MTYGDLWGSRKGGNRSGQGSDAKGGELHRVGVCWERVLWKGVSVVVSAVVVRRGIVSVPSWTCCKRDVL